MRKKTLKALEDTHVIVSDLRFGKTILADYIKKFVIDALRSGKFLNLKNRKERLIFEIQRLK